MFIYPEVVVARRQMQRWPTLAGCKNAFVVEKPGSVAEHEPNLFAAGFLEYVVEKPGSVAEIEDWQSSFVAGYLVYGLESEFVHTCPSHLFPTFADPFPSVSIAPPIWFLIRPEWFEYSEFHCLVVLSSLSAVDSMAREPMVHGNLKQITKMVFLVYNPS